MDAHLADAVPLDLLKTKQDGITAKLAAVEEALRQRHAQVGTIKEQRPQGILVGADSPTTPVEVVGWSQNNMMELVGLEPTTF